MLATKILGNVSSFDIRERELVNVYLEWFEFDKKLIKKDISDTESIGINIDKGEKLKEGDVLFEDESRVIALSMSPCELTVVKVDSMKAMGRLCFELGNRHLSLAIEDDNVSVIYDQPTFEYLERLGFKPQKVTGKFKNYTVCHAHGHSHGNDGGHSHEHSSGHAHSPEHEHSLEHEHSSHT
jgi:urease accessory protein